jgi:hypothetical protein
MMDPTTASTDAPEEDPPCTSWAICQDLDRLGWTANDPCEFCVGTAITKRAGLARGIVRVDAGRVQLVTADALDRLLNQACAARRDISTS